MSLPLQIVALLVTFLLATPVSLVAQASPRTTARTAAPSPGSKAAVTFEQASLDWDAGRYPESLRQLSALLRSGPTEEERQRIALLTGENWFTSLVGRNARAARWSPTGQMIAFERITGNVRATVIVRASDTFTAVVELPGGLVTFSPSGDEVLWVEGSSASGALHVRNIVNGTDITINDNGLQKAQLLYTASGEILAIAAPAGTTRSDLWRISRNGELQRLTSTDSLRADAQLVPGTSLVLLGLGGRTPISTGSGNAFARGSRTRFAVLDIATGAEQIFEGESPTVSADGKTVAFITRVAGRNTLHMMSLQPQGAAQAVHSTTDSLGAPALSPDGSLVAFQMQPRFDWDIYTVSRDGKPAVRITRDIQHDLQPRFVGNDQIIALTGEARHRRAQLYDLTNHTQRRLFHNNTIRTIAPEYEWVLSPDGRKLLIVAERDGDTVTPHRYLWHTDLGRTVTIPELQRRVAEQLAAETALRAESVRRFAPIADGVRAATAEVNTDRVYRHEKTLFDFDSKHLTQPGNLRAREYLMGQYTSFGLDASYQPFDARPNVNQPPVPTANVLAVLKGTENPELVYVISSHFDSRAEGPGADDNTSGTAALLEAARVLSTRPQPATIIFASFTGEESGLLGSREFVRQAKANGLKLVGALNNDMLGWSNDNRLDNTIRYSNIGIRDLQHAAAIEFSRMITYDAFYYKSTDAAAFYDGYGDIVGGIGSYPVLGNPHYHQPHDVLEVENHQLIAEASKTTIASVMLLASSPSRLAGLTVSTGANGVVSAAWTASPEKSVTKYQVRYGPVGAPDMYRADVTPARAVLVNAKPGMIVRVRAVNRKGLVGWDWAHFTIPTR